MKFDSIVKQCVLDQDVNDGKTLNKDFAKDFKADNSCETAESTVMEATWLSKVDAKKKVGSMVLWLKNRVDANYLLRTGTVSRVWPVMLHERVTSRWHKICGLIDCCCSGARSGRPGLCI